MVAGTMSAPSLLIGFGISSAIAVYCLSSLFLKVLSHRLQAEERLRPEQIAATVLGRECRGGQDGSVVDVVGRYRPTAISRDIKFP